MATKSEESLRAFVEEPEPTTEAQPAAAPVSSVLPGILPNAPTAKNSAASGKSNKTPANSKKAAGSPKPTPAQRKQARDAEQATTQIQSNLTDAGNRLAERIAGWDTPGGIGLLLLALFILLWMIVPVNGGHTRFGLLWLTLTGQTYLPDDTIPDSSGSSGSGGLGGLGGCPPGYIPDGKGGCIQAGAPFPGFPGLSTQPFQGSGWPDLSGPNGFNPGGWIGG